MWQVSSHSSTSRCLLSFPNKAAEAVGTHVYHNWRTSLPYPGPVYLCSRLYHSPSFHFELLLILSSWYLWSTDSSEEMTQNSDPLLPADPLPTMVLPFTHSANICWLLTRCPFLFVISLTNNSQVKNIVKHFQNPNYPWSVDWLRIKPF